MTDQTEPTQELAAPPASQPAQVEQEQPVAGKCGTWTVTLKDGTLTINDPQGKRQHITAGHLSTGYHLAMALDELRWMYRQQQPPAEPQPRERLTERDPPGWYECVQCGIDGDSAVMWWNGHNLFHRRDRDQTSVKIYTQFRGPLTYSPDLTRQLAEARQQLATEKECRTATEVSLLNLATYAANLDDGSHDLPMSGHAINIRDQIKRLDSLLATATEQLAEARQSLEACKSLALKTAEERNTLRREVERLLPSTFYADRQLPERVKLLVDDWRKSQEANEHYRGVIQAAEEQASKAEAACVAYRGWLVNESHWQDWREEFNIENTASGKNAKLLRDWLKSHGVDDAGREWLERLLSAEQQRDQLQAEVEKLRSQVLRGPAELGPGPWELFESIGKTGRGMGIVIGCDELAIRLPNKKGG